MTQQDNNKASNNGCANHPLIWITGFIASLIGIFSFVTGQGNLQTLFSQTDTNRPAPEVTKAITEPTQREIQSPTQTPGEQWQATTSLSVTPSKLLPPSASNTNRSPSSLNSKTSTIPRGRIWFCDLLDPNTGDCFQNRPSFGMETEVIYASWSGDNIPNGAWLKVEVNVTDITISAEFTVSDNVCTEQLTGKVCVDHTQIILNPVGAGIRPGNYAVRVYLDNSLLAEGEYMLSDTDSRFRIPG